ncbi:MAG: hypothetical protein ACOCRX_04305 [Candidatus Woesearchaeota archaeon]
MEFTIAQAVIALLLIGVVGSLGSRVIIDTRDDVLDRLDEEDDVGFKPYQPRLTPTEEIVVDNIKYFKEGVEIYHKLTSRLREETLINNDMVMSIEGVDVYSIAELIEFGLEDFDNESNDDYVYLSNACTDYLKSGKPSFRLSFDDMDDLDTKNEIISSYFCGVVEINDHDSYPNSIEYEDGNRIIDRSNYEFSEHFLSLNSKSISHHAAQRANQEGMELKKSRINLLFQLEGNSDEEITHILVPFDDYDDSDCFPSASSGGSRNVDAYRDCLKNNYSFYYLKDSDLEYKVSPLVYEWRDILPNDNLDNRYTIPYFFLPQTCYHSKFDSECPSSDDGPLVSAIEYLKVEEKYPDYILFHQSFPENEDHYWRMNMTDSILMAMGFNALTTGLVEFFSPTSAGLFGSIKQEMFGRSVVSYKGTSLLTSAARGALNLGSKAITSDAFIFSLYFMKGFEYERGVNIQEFFDYNHDRGDLILASPGNVKTASFDTNLPLFINKGSDEIDTHQNFHLVSPCLSNLDFSFKDIDYELSSDVAYFNDGVLGLDNGLERELNSASSNLDCSQEYIYDQFSSLNENQKEGFLSTFIGKFFGKNYDVFFDLIYLENEESGSFNRDEIYDFYDFLYSECKSDNLCDFMIDFYNLGDISEEKVFKFFTNLNSIQKYNESTNETLLFDLFPKLKFSGWDVDYSWGDEFDFVFPTSYNIPAFLFPIGLMEKYNENSLKDTVKIAINDYSSSFKELEGDCDKIVSMINDSFYYDFYYDRFSFNSYYDQLYGDDYARMYSEGITPYTWIDDFNVDNINSNNQDIVCYEELTNFLNSEIVKIKSRLESEECEFIKNDDFGYLLNDGFLDPTDGSRKKLMPNHYCVKKIHKLDNILSKPYLSEFVKELHSKSIEDSQLRENFNDKELNDMFFFDLIFPTIYIDEDRVHDVDSYLRPFSVFFSFLYDNPESYFGDFSYIDFDGFKKVIKELEDKGYESSEKYLIHDDPDYYIPRLLNEIAVHDDSEFKFYPLYNLFLYEPNIYDFNFDIPSDNFLTNYLKNLFGYYYDCSDNSIINDVRGNYKIASNDDIKSNQIFESIDLKDSLLEEIASSTFLKSDGEEEYFNHFYGDKFTTKNNLLISPEVLDGFCYGNLQNLHNKRRNQLITLAVLQYPLRWGLIGPLYNTGAGAPLARVSDSAITAGISAFTTYNAYRTLKHNRWPQGPGE